MLKFFSNDGLPNKPFVFFVSALVGVVIIGEIVYCGFKFDTGELFHRKPQPIDVSVKNYNTDRREVILNFERTPERIIAYHQNNIEILDKFGERDRIIASVGRFIIPHDVKQQEIDRLINKIPYYGQNGIDKETARYLNPDFIMGWPSSFGKRGVWSLGDTDYWLKRNVNCYMSLQQKDGKLYETMDGEYQYILDIGKILKKDAEAMQIVSDIKSDVNKILSDNQHRKQQKVLILDFYGNTISSYGENRLAGNIVQALGASLIKTNSKIGKEDILLADPDVIFLIYKTDADLAFINKFMQNEEFRSLKAIRKGRVYMIPISYIYNSGLRLSDTIHLIAAGLYN